MIPDFKPVPMLTPPAPILEDAIGYTESARWVAFYWTPYGDEAMFDDGRVSGDGHWHAYLAWVNYPRNRGALGMHLLNLGSSEFVASEWLLLDRETRNVYVGPAGDVARFLKQQWSEPAEVKEVDARAILKAFQRAVDQVDAEMKANMDHWIANAIQRDQENLDRLQTALDALAVPCLEK